MNNTLLTLIDIDVTGEKTKTLIDIIKDGGWTMVPLFLLSVAAIYILIERFLTIQAASKKSSSFMPKIKEAISKKDLDSAIETCKSFDSPASRMIEKGIRRLGSPVKSIEEAIENVGKIEIDRLEKGMSALATIAGAAPMIGFLGTVLGMMETFQSIVNLGNANVSDMAGGISTAMITTATGLIVGIIAYVAYNYLSAKLQRVIHNMEHSSIEFLDLLHEPQK